MTNALGVEETARHEIAYAQQVAASADQMTDEELGNALEAIRDGTKILYASRMILAHQIEQRLKESGGKMLPHSRLEIRRSNSPSYRVAGVRKVLDLLPEDETEGLIYTPKPKPAEKIERVNGSVARRLCNNYGGEVKRILDEAEERQEWQFSVKSKRRNT